MKGLQFSRKIFRAQQARHAGARHHSSTQQSSATVQPLISNSLHANSSPSEAGSQASQASNMMSGASAESGTSQRSVYLHAATVADIPAASPTAAPAGRPGLRAQSRGDLSPRSVVSDAATMRRARHTSRSFSVLAPWKPRHYREKYEITYTNNQLPLNNQNVATLGKPPRPPRKKEDNVSDSEQFTRASAARSSTAAKNSGFAAWFRKKKR